MIPLSPETDTDTLVTGTMRRGTRVGILMCDMSFFKEVNDTYGHETGDAILINQLGGNQICRCDSLSSQE
ncbi:MAG: diguanylate cyclase [Deltaproteobacteria bacterium]|nr:diguanylate cyclase [Deltaproteobacteria bacterium]